MIRRALLMSIFAFPAMAAPQPVEEQVWHQVGRFCGLTNPDAKRDLAHQIGWMLLRANERERGAAWLRQAATLGYEGETLRTQLKLLPPSTIAPCRAKLTINPGKGLRLQSVEIDPPVREIGSKTREANARKRRPIPLRFGPEQPLPVSLTLPVAGHLSSPFGLRVHPIKGVVRHHGGMDIAAPEGTPIKAVANGTVDDLGLNGGYGKYIRIDHGGIDTAYGHLSRFADDLREGTKVTKGQIIGYVGSTGISTGPHLHFEIIRGGQRIDPHQHLPKADAKLELKKPEPPKKLDNPDAENGYM